MLSEDYIIRMINLAIAAMLQILGLKKAGDFQSALLLIDVTFEQLIGLRASMAKNLDDDRLYFLLTRHDQLDTRRLSIVADLFQEEGDIYAALRREQESRDDYTRALRYNLEVLFNETQEGIDTDELKQKIEALVQKLDLSTLGTDTLWPLAGYYEESGAYAKAEAVLLGLSNRPEIQADIRPEIAGFYQRLMEKAPDELEKGGLTKSQVKERLAQWNAEK